MLPNGSQVFFAIPNYYIINHLTRVKNLAPILKGIEKKQRRVVVGWDVVLFNAPIRQAQVTPKDTCGSGLQPRIKTIAAASRSLKLNKIGVKSTFDL